MPFGAKEKGEIWVWFGTSKDRKVIHMEIEKQMFGKCLLGHLNNGTQRGLATDGP